MKKYIVLLAILFSACKKYYIPEVDKMQSLISISGLLSNESGSLYVTIANSTPFGSKEYGSNVDNAKVYITDDLGNVIDIPFSASGIYRNRDFIGDMERIYTLHVFTANGDEYISSPQKMPVPNKQDSVYGAYEEKEYLTQSFNNSYFLTREKGVNIYSNLSSTTDDLPRSRFEALVTVLYMYQIPTNMMPITVYCWNSFNPNVLPSVTTDKFARNEKVVKQQNVCFFVNNLDTHVTSDYQTTLLGWLLQTWKYNLSKEAHDYYIQVNNQLQADGKLFDPLPKQLKGNMKCVNRPDDIVLGFFEVSSVNRYYYRLKLDAQVGFVEKDGFPEFTYSGAYLEGADTTQTHLPLFYFN